MNMYKLEYFESKELRASVISENIEADNIDFNNAGFVVLYKNGISFHNIVKVVPSFAVKSITKVE